MIRNLEKEDKWGALQERVMITISRILKTQTRNSLFLAAVETFLTVLASSSVLFMKDPFEPQPANEIFKFFVISHIDQLLDLDPSIILIVFVVLNLLITVLIGFNCCKSPFSYSIKALSFAIPIVKMLSVPLFYFLIENIGLLIVQKGMQVSEFLLRALFIVTTPIIIFFVSLYVFFSIRPLRFENIMWNYDNSKQFFYHVFGLARALVIYFDSCSILILVVNLIIQLDLAKSASSFMCPKVALLQRSKNTICLIIGLSLVLGVLFGNKSIGFVIFSVGCAFSLLLNFIELISLSRRSSEIPSCIFENASQFYSFYIHLKNQNGNTHEEITQSLRLHQLECRQEDCVFKDISLDIGSNKITLEDIEQRISKFLKSFRYKTPESELMYQIWKIELNKTITLSHGLRQFRLEHKFIVHYALGTESSNKQQVMASTNSNAPSESLNGKWAFYKQLGLAVERFQRLGQILCKPFPKLSEVVSVVLSISDETAALTRLFEEMIRNKDVNYICIELYLKFFDCFLSEKRLSSDLLDKLKRLRILADSDMIEEKPLPCFVVDSITQAVEKVNAQALKFMKYHRHEIKDKNFNAMVVPSFNIKEIYQYQTKNGKQEFLPLFFKVRTANKTDLICRNIKIKLLQNNNKSYYQIEVHKKYNGSTIVDILIDDELNVVASTMETISIPYRDGKKEQKLQFIYEGKIREVLKDTSLTKVGRVEFQDNCLVTGMIVEKFCPYNNLRLFSFNLVKKNNSSRSNKRVSQARLSKLYDYPGVFSFFYKFDSDENAVLEGSQFQKSSDDPIINENLSMRTLNQKFVSFIAQITNEPKLNFSAGIKVYRLYQGDLYNIDLQDREKYEEQFNNVESKFQSYKLYDCKINQNCLIVALIVLAALVTGCSLFLSITSDQQLSFISQEQIKMLYIQEFSLNYNRIMATLRDVANGLFENGKNFKEIVLDSYSELQKYDSSDFLSEEPQLAVYFGERYKGSLSQLIEVSLTHVYEFIQLLDNEIIEHIHDFALRYLGPLLSNEKESKKVSIEQSISTLSKYSLFCFIFILAGTLFYFIMFIVLSQQFKKKMNIFLEPLLVTSDSEAKRISQDCQKFMNIITNLYRNYEVDIESIGQKKDDNKKRARPKRVDFGLCSIMTQILIGGLIVVTLMSLAFLQFTIIKNQMVTISELFNEAAAVMESYSGLSWTTNQIDHLGIIRFDQIAKLSQDLDLIENKKDMYQFSDQLTEVVKMVFFSDSCSYLVSKGIIQQKWCGDSMEGFIQKNPFRIGLDLYFRRMNYNLVTNLTETYASNGIYSEPFKEIFKYFSIKIRTEIELKMATIRSTLLTIAVMVTTLSFVLIFMLFISMAYFKTKMGQIGRCLANLIGQSDTKVGSEGQQNKKKAKIDDNSSIAENVEESDYLIIGQDAPDEVRQD